MRAILVTAIAAIAVAAATYTQIRPQPVLKEFLGRTDRPLILDSTGSPLRYSYADEWNCNEIAGLASIPPLLISAVIAAEDGRYFSHKGVDWWSRANGLWLNLRKFRTVRGSSTITEQVVRMIYPRRRTFWSKWIEGWEAYSLERKNSKNEILEFYLNQVPFNERRRGVVQAARGFFGRDLSVLTKSEIIAIAAMIKNPSRMGRGYLELGRRLGEDLSSEQLRFAAPTSPLAAPHFISFVKTQPYENPTRTTLDPGLQRSAQKLLDEVLKSESKHEMNNGAVILADHQTDEILVWSVGDGKFGQATAYNAVLQKRQPGSSLKPFLYATAFESGFAPDTLVEDAPLADSVGAGLHNYRNYSRVFYGWISLREALANSLNVPGIRIIKQIGVDSFLHKLKLLHLDSLTQSAAHYGEGLALGNGEVSLLEMIGAYGTLARSGIYRPLRVLRSQKIAEGERIFTERSALAVSSILSDANARRLEFGRGGNLEFPVQTAVKTGTSTDFRDAWAFAYNYKFVAGIWIGNLNNRPTNGLSGSAAPMLVLRALMNEAIRGRITEKLTRATDLTGIPKIESDLNGFRIKKPGEHTHMALDPRIPVSSQAFTFEVEGHSPEKSVSWWIDGKKVGENSDGKLKWPLVKGRHEVMARQGFESGRRVFHVR